MSLSILSIDPQDQQLNITLDKIIKLTFSEAIDPFTVLKGIGIYTQSSQSWTGSELASLATNTSDVTSTGLQNNYLEYSYTLSYDNTVLTITPSDQLLDNSQYFIQIFPGSDSKRFLSSKTCNAPVYTKNANTPSDGEVDITSTYSGSVNGSYIISITGTNTADVLFNGIPKDSITFINNTPIAIDDNLSVSFNGSFDINDLISIDVFKASGFTTIFKASFTTSSYVTTTVKSKRIEDEIFKLTVGAFKVLSVFPQDQSINNQNVNPITIKFNKAIDTSQDITQYITIVKKDMDTAIVKRIGFYYVVNPVNKDTLKIYLNSVDNSPIAFKETYI